MKQRYIIATLVCEKSISAPTNDQLEKIPGVKFPNTAEVDYHKAPSPIDDVLGGVGNRFQGIKMSSRSPCLF